MQLLVLLFQKIIMENRWFYSIKISRKMLFFFTHFQFDFLPYQLNWAPDQKTISKIGSVLLLRRSQIVWHRKIVYWTLLLFIFLHTYKENSKFIHAVWIRKKQLFMFSLKLRILYSHTHIRLQHTYTKQNAIYRLAGIFQKSCDDRKYSLTLPLLFVSKVFVAIFLLTSSIFLFLHTLLLFPL